MKLFLLSLLLCAFLCTAIHETIMGDDDDEPRFMRRRRGLRFMRRFRRRMRHRRMELDDDEFIQRLVAWAKVFRAAKCVYRKEMRKLRRMRRCPRRRRRRLGVRLLKRKLFKVCKKFVPKLRNKFIETPNKKKPKFILKTRKLMLRATDDVSTEAVDNVIFNMFVKLTPTKKICKFAVRKVLMPAIRAKLRRRRKRTPVRRKLKKALKVCKCLVKRIRKKAKGMETEDKREFYTAIANLLQAAYPETSEKKVGVFLHILADNITSPKRVCINYFKNFVLPEKLKKLKKRRHRRGKCPRWRRMKLFAKDDDE